MNDTQHGMSRRRMLGTIAGAAGAVAVGAAGWAPSAAAEGNGLLVPTGKRGIILYSVRDRISAAPDTSGVPYGFERVLGRLAEIGYKEVEFAGYTQNTGHPRPADHPRGDPQDPGRQRAAGERLPRLGAEHGHPGHHRRFEQTLDIAEILGMTHIGTGNDPTGSAYQSPTGTPPPTGGTPSARWPPPQG